MSILDGVSFFDSLTADDKRHLSYFCQKKEITTGEILFRQGDEPNAFYVVTSGSFSVLQESEGKEQKLGPVEVGDILGEMALFGEGVERNATVIAQEDATVITILDFSIKELTKNNPDILEKIQKVISERT